MNLRIILSWDGDKVGQDVTLATRADDVEGVRQISQNVDHATQIWRSWVEANGGSIVSLAGDAGVAEVSAEKLGDLPKIREQYSQTIDSPVSVGVGVKLSESAKALKVAQKRGGNCIVLFSPEIEKELEEKKEDKHDILSLAKAASALNQGGGAGMQGASIPSAPSIAQPKAEGSEHSEAEAIRPMVEGSEAPPKPEMTNAAATLEDKMHEIAAAQDEQDSQQPEAQGSGNPIKAQVVQVLQKVKAAAPMLERIAQSSPEVYEAVMQMTRAVIAMARELPHDTPDGAGPHTVAEIDAAAGLSKSEVEFIQKSEALLKAGEFREAGFRHIKTGEIVGTGPFHDTDQIPGGDPFEWDDGFIDHQGNFYTRLEAAAKINAIKTPAQRFPLLPPSKNVKERPSGLEGLESSGYFGGKEDPTIAGMMSHHPEGFNLGDRRVKQRLTANWKKYNTKYAIKKSEDEELLKSLVGWKAAFRHKQNGNVIVMPTFHDVTALPEANGKWDEAAADLYDDGFVNPQGEFRTRVEAKPEFANGFADSLNLPHNQADAKGIMRDMSDKWERHPVAKAEYDGMGRHNCAFCCVPKQVTEKGREEILQQVDAFAKHLPADLIYLNDKTFGQAPNHAMLPEIYQRIKAKNPNFKGFVIQTTAAQMKRFTPEYLKAAGIKHVEIGVESFNDPILRAHKKPATEQLIEEAAQKLRQSGVSLIPNIMVGLPGENKETYGRTMDWLNRNKDIISHVNAYNLALYDDSALGKKIGALSSADRDENQIGKSFHTNPQDHADFHNKLFDFASRQLDAGPMQKAESPIDSLAKNDEMVSPEGEHYDVGDSHPTWAQQNRHLVGFIGTKGLEGETPTDPNDMWFDNEDRCALDHFMENGWTRVKGGSGVSVGSLGSHNVAHVKNILRSMARQAAGRGLYVDGAADSTLHVPVSHTGRPDFNEIDEHVAANDIDKAELQLEDLTGGLSEGKSVSDFDPKAIAKGVLVELEHTDKIQVAVKIAMDHLVEDSKYYDKLEEVEGKEPVQKDELQKGKLPMPKVPTREHVILPVGSQLDSGPESNRNVGKVKTQGADAHSKWREVRAGMVLGADGSARSSLAVNKK